MTVLDTASDSLAAAQERPSSDKSRTIWGLDPVALHHRFWAAHGIQVVRQGEPSEIVDHAELYLLTDPRSLVLFRMTSVIDVLNWLKPQVLFLRLHDRRERGYREKVITDGNNRFLRFQRLYDGSEDLRLARAVLTPERELARLWQSSPDPLTGWRRLRRYTPQRERSTLSIDGSVFDRSVDREIATFLRDLTAAWKHPDSTIGRAELFEPQVWKDPQGVVDPEARFVGPVWVGAGRRIDGGTTIVGPAIIWDDPECRPPTEEIQWLTIEPRDTALEAAVKDLTAISRTCKRGFDIAFSLAVLMVTIWIYPLIMLAIWLDDGRPFFFTHRRESAGGREFGCIKFRSMRKNAEQQRAQLQAQNEADGPQFYIEKDPRLTKAGRFLRKYNLDELPQFINVLLGHMSVVGPRPSPRGENQYCPPWRDARLSVRPGITGLWQIHRTRRSGTDFQEWIKYDIEYVENRSWRLDLWIIWKTITQVFRKVSRS
ncbi:MAG: sugar transferase [Tepidisphaeraceae bacterium]|jgi:lipopolysaccharide/colanic/teichoic acid biosynthesis glycosyltransferase